MEKRTVSYGCVKGMCWGGFILLLGALAGTVGAQCASPCGYALPCDLCRDILLAYPLDRGTGMRVVDESGVGLHGILRGAWYTEDEERGRVLAFAGLRDHLVVPEVQLDGFTFSAWVRTGTRDVDKRVLMQVVDTESFLSIQGNSEGSLGVVIGEGREANDYDWPLPAKVWCHVCVTYDGEEVTLYRDGRLCYRQVLPARLPLTGELTFGGSRHKEGRSWMGRIDDVILVNRVLDKADVDHLYRAGRDLPVQPHAVASDEFIIEALIDDTSELHILPDLIYWTNNCEYAKPGRACNRYEPTWINGRPWRPHWDHHRAFRGLDLSSEYGLSIEPALYAPELVAVGTDRCATAVERGRIVAQRDGQSLVLRFEDWQPGARWYRVRLYPWRYVDPVERISVPEPYCGTKKPSKAPKTPVSCPAQSAAAPPACQVTPPPVPPLSPEVVIQSTEMAPATVPSVPPDTMIIDAYIDDVSDLWIKGDGLVWKNVTSAAKPGRGDGHNEPTWINGQPWYPVWYASDQDQGIDLSDLRPHPLAPGFYQAELLAVGYSPRDASNEAGSIETIALPESLVVRFNEPGRQPRWYRIRVTRK